MTARQVVELIRQNQGIPWNERSTRDTFKVGNPDSTVKGIATTMMTTFDMLKRAHAAGLNMVITHEDTYWNDRDDTKDLTENPLYKLKTEFVLKNDMVVCQRKVEMSYSLQSRNVRFWPGGVRGRGSLGVPVKRRRAMLASNPIKE